MTASPAASAGRVRDRKNLGIEFPSHFVEVMAGARFRACARFLYTEICCPVPDVYPMPFVRAIWVMLPVLFSGPAKSGIRYCSGTDTVCPGYPGASCYLELLPPGISWRQELFQPGIQIWQMAITGWSETRHTGPLFYFSRCGRPYGAKTCHLARPGHFPESGRRAGTAAEYAPQQRSRRAVVHAGRPLTGSGVPRERRRGSFGKSLFESRTGP